MATKILITGGAGFIGSHLADALLESGYEVRALDSLSPQVHPDGKRPDYLDREVELMVGDVRDPAAMKKALAGVDAVYHLAAAVGVGQSMYAIEEYVSVNSIGTAVLLEALIERPVERLVVASSMSIYGEGLYKTKDGVPYPMAQRSMQQLRERRWDPRDSQGRPLIPVPTPETKTPALTSIYALSKYDQENMCLITGKAYNIETVALRFFNIFGTRQALSNPYTGVLAIFASRILNGNPPRLFEDGAQRRDFIDVRDVARACRLALEMPGAAYGVFNVGSGNAYTIKELAERMARAMGRESIRPVVTDTCRVGDIRNCFADIGQAGQVLGFAPEISLERGIADLAAWLEGRVCCDHVEEATSELMRRGLALARAEA